MRRLFVALLFALPLWAHAQYTLPGFQGALRIGMTPVHPAPGQVVHLSLESALIDLDSSTITWTVDGKRAATSGTTLDINAGALGSNRSVSADVVSAEGSIVSAETTITPTELDLLYDSDSYVPPLYQGRALPSAGSTLRLVAIPHFKRPGGSEAPVSDITFTWRRNGQALGSLSGKGKNTISIPAPYLYGTDYISVEAATSDGTLSGDASVSIPAADPIVRLYEDHPLFGLRLDKALASTTNIVDREMTFAAIPFFATAASPADDALSYAWTVDGKSVNTNGDTKHELTLGASGGGDAHLSVAITHVSNIFFSADSAWHIIFNSNLGTDNVFESTR